MNGRRDEGIHLESVLQAVNECRFLFGGGAGSWQRHETEEEDFILDGFRPSSSTDVRRWSCDLPASVPCDIIVGCDFAVSYSLS